MELGSEEKELSSKENRSSVLQRQQQPEGSTMPTEPGHEATATVGADDDAEVELPIPPLLREQRLALLQSLLHSAGNDDWPEWFTVNSAVVTLRQICRHEPTMLVAENRFEVAKMVALLLRLTDSPRSSVARSALVAFSDLFRALQRPLQTAQCQDIVNSLLKKSSTSEKRFLADAANNALVALVTHQPSADLFSLLMEKRLNKNAKLVALSCRLALKMSVILEPEEIKNLCSEANLNCLMDLLASRSVEARAPSLELVKHLQTVVGEEEFRLRIAHLAETDKNKLISLLSPTKGKKVPARVSVKDLRAEFANLF